MTSFTVISGFRQPLSTNVSGERVVPVRVVTPTSFKVVSFNPSFISGTNPTKVAGSGL